MASFHSPLIFNRIRGPPNPLRLQRRWARVHDVRFVATRGDTKSILEKYRDKLDKKAKEEGHKSINSLKEAYQDRISDLRRKATTIPSAASPAPNLALQQPPPPVPKPQLPGTVDHAGCHSSTPGIKPLSACLDLAKVSALPKKEVEHIWRLRHASDPLSLCAVIPIETYNRIYHTAKNHPQFILPLPRPAAGRQLKASRAAKEQLQTSTFYNGASTHLLYLQHQVPPRSTRTLQLYCSPTLPPSRCTGLEGRGLSAEEGRWLVMCLQKFYDFEGHGGGIGKEKRQGLLEKFSKGDQGFNLDELVDEAERVS
ncbi:hypothetical protein EPUS_08865 [Endocarpon pusillum Z07020]|uniref:Uncharacterized protein n=1 Tax=Endocarpon pusillum (strain Z07020 / HMAS-L-300199) TaxID=1263415 RepID=U1HWQ1_ENDPU|nr:uncharacterized protein EPUS_08865 [Endocarpon pusillum Z07020]ERF75195.1 hypothetical protein EPUS_08865 [Endocarpon pusillum Z07020]